MTLAKPHKILTTTIYPAQPREKRVTYSQKHRGGSIQEEALLARLTVDQALGPSVNLAVSIEFFMFFPAKSFSIIGVILPCK